jgi:hypothetical protein
MSRFPLGQLLATPGVLDAAAGEDLMPYLRCHVRLRHPFLNLVVARLIHDGLTATVYFNGWLYAY